MSPAHRLTRRSAFALGGTGHFIDLVHEPASWLDVQDSCTEQIWCGFVDTLMFDNLAGPSFAFCFFALGIFLRASLRHNWNTRVGRCNCRSANSGRECPYRGYQLALATGGRLNS